VAAATKEEAFHKAQEMGQQEEDTFFNRKEQLVQWKFINISELYRLSELRKCRCLYLHHQSKSRKYRSQ
jgi:hypothetical protein